MTLIEIRLHLVTFISEHTVYLKDIAGESKMKHFNPSRGKISSKAIATACFTAVVKFKSNDIHVPFIS